MHELSIAHDMLGIVEKQLAQYPGARVESINLLVGVYSGVDPEALRFAFPVVVKGTSIESAELVIKSLPLSFKCRDCGETAIEAGTAQCPRCHSINIAMESGTELEISSLELILPDDEVISEKDKGLKKAKGIRDKVK